jgi:Cu+-exporting ATPase
MSAPIRRFAMAQVKDPVCGMTISPEDAVETADHDDVTYYFCSRDCAESFREAPEDYI